MMKKLQEAQRQMSEIKARLEHITVDGKSTNADVTVTANGNRKIVDVRFSEQFQTLSKQAQEQMTQEAVNAAIGEADKVNETEMKAAASGMMPGMGGLFGKS